MSEGAHIRALGKPHLGPDVPEKVLCLCPNHHALFDDGGIYIGDDLRVRNYAGDVIAQLHMTSEHSSGLEHLK
jgi:putative restriction endonuclease